MHGACIWIIIERRVLCMKSVKSCFCLAPKIYETAVVFIVVLMSLDNVFTFKIDAMQTQKHVTLRKIVFC